MWATLRRFMIYLWPKDAPALRARVVVAMLAVLASKAITLIMPFAYKGVIDRMAPGMQAGALIAIALVCAYAGARFGGVLFDNLRNVAFERVGQEATRRLAEHVFIHLHRLSLRFHLNRKTGAVTKVIERGTKSIDTMLYFLLFNIAPTIIELTAVCVIFFVKFGPGMVAATLAMVVAYIWFTRTVTEWRNQLRRDMVDLDTDAMAHAVDSLLNFETVKYFSAEEREARRYSRRDDPLCARGGEIGEQPRRAQHRAGAHHQPDDGGRDGLYRLGLEQGAVHHWRRRAGEHAARPALPATGHARHGLSHDPAGADRHGGDVRPDRHACRNRTRRVRDRSTSAPEKCNSRMCASAMTPIAKLHGLSLSMPPGHTLAIVGPTGAGKSTIARLLYRFYDVQGGRITIDGQDIAQVSQDSLRAQIGIVPQDMVLFNDTIAYNIAYGREGAGQAEIEAAARGAAIHDFIVSLPKGYQTRVGERGLKLSGGEKQRVAIARTLLKDPPILILDEATSALDSRTEASIQQVLRDMVQMRTTIIVAHRLSTVVDADEIIVLEQGRIAERGTHAALVARGGLYAQMWAQQAQERESDDADDAAEPIDA
jgi:ABC-type transport system involved in Fe-S cluster assembly fused permease/ATPase subunit